MNRSRAGPRAGKHGGRMMRQGGVAPMPNSIVGPAADDGTVLVSTTFRTTS